MVGRCTGVPVRRWIRVALVVLAAAATLTIGGGSAAGAATPCGQAGAMSAGKAGGKSGGAHAMHDMDMPGMGGTKRSGGSGTPCPTVPGARRIEVVADGFAFEPAAISVAAGEDVTIALTARDLAHDVQVKRVGHVVHAKAGRTAVGGLRIDEPGTYRFWCTVPGHRAAGMSGTITVS